MSCNAAYSLGAALRSCGVCSPMPPARKWVLADRVTQDRCQPGMEVQVRLDGVPATDTLGRKAHVRGILFNATAVNDIPGATNDAVSGYNMRSIWQALFLEDTSGHQYWQALDGRTILDDQWFRFYRLCQFPTLWFGAEGAPFPTISSDQGIPANAGAGTIDRSVTLYAPLARPAGVEGSPLEGLIPLAALQRVGAGALRVRIATEYAGSPSGVAFQSLQVDNLDGTTRAGMDVWLDVVYLPAFVIDAAWALREYTLSDQSGILRFPDQLTEYAHIRYFPEDTSPGSLYSGQGLAAAHNGITLRVAGFTEMGGFQLGDAITRMVQTIASDIDSAIITGNAQQAVPMADVNGNITQLFLLPNRPRDVAAAGPINYEYAERDAIFTRYVHRVVRCHTEQRGEKLADALQCNPCSTFGTNGNGKVQPKVASFEPAIVSPTNLRR